MVGPRVAPYRVIRYDTRGLFLSEPRSVYTLLCVIVVVVVVFSVEGFVCRASGVGVRTFFTVICWYRR